MKAYLRTRKNAKCYYCLLKWQSEGKQQTKEISTGIEIKGNNKRKAEKKCEEIRKEYEEKYENTMLGSNRDILFTDYLQEWLESVKRIIKPTTYYGYSNNLRKHIIPYFKKQNVRLIDLTPTHIQRYYNQKLDEGLLPIQSKDIMRISGRLYRKGWRIISYLSTWQTEQSFQRQKSIRLKFITKSNLPCCLKL